MSEVTAPAKPAQARQIHPLHVLIVGRVEKVEVTNSTRSTEILCPAFDRYSTPEIVQIRSKRPIGTKGEEIQQWGRIGGFRGRPFDVTDKSTGEVRRARQVILTIDAIEE